jgi:hypothetical protein
MNPILTHMLADAHVSDMRAEVAVVGGAYPFPTPPRPARSDRGGHLGPRLRCARARVTG